MLDVPPDAWRIVMGEQRQYLRIDHAGHMFRLDVVAGTWTGDPATIRFELALGPQLPIHLEVLRSLHDFTSGKRPAHRPHRKEAGALRGLWALDARRAGASLREIADLLLGPGDWPGEGEHRKSRARRLVVMGEATVTAGAGAVFAGKSAVQ